jgi:hypothetical protein
VLAALAGDCITEAFDRRDSSDVAASVREGGEVLEVAEEESDADRAG